MSYALPPVVSEQHHNTPVGNLSQNDLEAGIGLPLVDEEDTPLSRCITTKKAVAEAKTNSPRKTKLKRKQDVKNPKRIMKPPGTKSTGKNHETFRS